MKFKSQKDWEVPFPAIQKAYLFFKKFSLHAITRKQMVALSLDSVITAPTLPGYATVSSLVFNLEIFQVNDHPMTFNPTRRLRHPVQA